MNQVDIVMQTAFSLPAQQQEKATALSVPSGRGFIVAGVTVKECKVINSDIPCFSYCFFSLNTLFFLKMQNKVMHFAYMGILSIFYV